MAAYQGTYYSVVFALDSRDGTRVDITGWEFSADLRDTRASAELINLTTANGGFTVLDGINGQMSLNITAEQTLTLPTGRIVFDVLRTDAVPGPVYVFGGSFIVKQPVTREN